ncbi:hypothetical protein A6D6_01989 [Alcanivorax xiamenensis]|uniref:Uncharacterized protein n=1 Tax=Alcanivorax xiamenensis TaxID=1177156 RepID=A0ABQ6Y8L9_9GAMM|nr:hypothetical protein [Alcanivorax xiamenensis]KAF0805933.1 hypothetical protein A6D6_01989 [Alcanivorax xiamenensis]
MKKMRKPMRNPAACNPLMRKGGPHQPGRQAVRPRLDWRDALEDYDDWQQEEENKEGPDGPSFLVHRGLEGNRIAFHQGQRSRVTPLRERREAGSAKA